MDNYKRDMQQNYAWQQFYNHSVPNDNGVTSPEGYTLAADPGVPYVITQAALGADSAPVNYNPAAMLYTSGQQNLRLLASANNQCDSGCVVSVHKSDPRVRQVKPLYEPSVFKASAGQPLPTAYNVVGMY